MSKIKVRYGPEIDDFVMVEKSDEQEQEELDAIERPASQARVQEAGR